MTSERTVVYKLAGRSLEAALRLGEELQAEIAQKRPQQTGTLKDIGDSWQSVYSALKTRLASEAPELLTETGLTSPSVQIFQGPQSLPRAYEVYPDIIVSPERNPEYFMYVPVDYKGDHYVPADGILQSEQEVGRLSARLFADGWLGNGPIVATPRKGVETPADYIAPAQSELRAAFPYAANDRTCFLAEGRSLAAVKDLRRRTDEWKQSIDQVFTAAKAAVEEMRDQILAFLPAGEDFYINTSYSYSQQPGDQARLELSVRRAGKTGMMQAGQPVALPAIPAFEIRNDEGVMRIAARTDTPEGRAFAKLLEAIPSTPSLQEYPELHASKRAPQQAVDLGGHTLLIYNAAPEGFCPPGAKPFPTEAYEWLRADQGDHNMGVTPPPMPLALQKLLGTTPQPRRRTGRHFDL